MLMSADPRPAPMPSDHGLEPGDQGLAFSLPNSNPSLLGDTVSLEDVMTERGAVVMFTCNHCPYVIASEERIQHVAKRAGQEGIGFVGISSNDASVYPEDSWEHMQKRCEDGLPYAYLFDESQEVANAWGAQRTPEFYLLSGDGQIVYRGRLDDSPRDPTRVHSTDLVDAMDAMLMGETPPVARTESIGCSVKWK